MLTELHLQQIMSHAPRARLEAFLEPLRRALDEFEIGRSLQRIAAFVAQLAHESGEFRHMEEVWGPTPAQQRYEPVTRLSRALGNTEPGDGLRFKGRGPIQVTGRANYARYGALLGVDLVARPETAATPGVGFRIAGLYWQRNGLNERADARDFDAITRRINGGLNGQPERLRYYERALEVLAGAFPASATRGPARPAPRFEPLERGAEALRREEEAAPRPREEPQPSRGRDAPDG
jgi:predicted chitinase